MVYIVYKNKTIPAYTDGKGDAFQVDRSGKPYAIYENIAEKCTEERKYNPEDYEFDRFFRGMDF